MVGMGLPERRSRRPRESCAPQVRSRHRAVQWLLEAAEGRCFRYYAWGIRLKSPGHSPGLLDWELLQARTSTVSEAGGCCNAPGGSL